MTDPLPQHTHRTLPIALAIAVLTHVPTAHAEEVQVDLRQRRYRSNRRVTANLDLLGVGGRHVR